MTAFNYRVNRLKAAIAEGEAIAGLVVQVSSAEVVEMAGASRFDYVWIDCEHGSFYLEQATEMIRAADAIGITALVRVPSLDPSFIMRVLDAGAQGIVAPNVVTADQARAVVAATKYKSGGNGGVRGACPGSRATWHQSGNWKEYTEHANASTVAWVIVEKPEAVKNIDSILEVEGLDAVVLGNFDLAHEMGYPGEVSHREVQAALDHVTTRAQAKGVQVVASFFAPTPDLMEREREIWSRRGVRIFSIGSDRRLIVNAMKERVAAAKGSKS